MSTAYVLVEYDGDQVLPITGELITAAKVFESVTAVVVGPAGAHEPLVPQPAAPGRAGAEPETQASPIRPDTPS